MLRLKLQYFGHLMRRADSLEKTLMRSYPTPEVRGGGREEQPHIQGVAAVQVQEDREELLHVQGQEGWP